MHLTISCYSIKGYIVDTNIYLRTLIILSFLLELNPESRFVVRSLIYSSLWSQKFRQKWMVVLANWFYFLSLWAGYNQRVDRSIGIKAVKQYLSVVLSV